MHGRLFYAMIAADYCCACVASYKHTSSSSFSAARGVLPRKHRFININTVTVSCTRVCWSREQEKLECYKCKRLKSIWADACHQNVHGNFPTQETGVEGERSYSSKLVIMGFREVVKHDDPSRGLYQGYNSRHMETKKDWFATVCGPLGNWCTDPARVSPCVPPLILVVQILTWAKIPASQRRCELVKKALFLLLLKYSQASISTVLAVQLVSVLLVLCWFQIPMREWRNKAK